MLFSNSFRPQAVVCRAPFDVTGGVGCCPNHVSKEADQAAPKAGGGASLDSNGKSTCGCGGSSAKDLKDRERSGAARTLDRYRLQRHAAKILDWPKALSACEYARREGVDKIQVWRNEAAERGAWSRYVGLQTCKLLWTCPVCSNRRAWSRRQDLQTLIDYAQTTGLTLVMLTLTSSHDLDTSLLSQRAMMKKAKAGLTSRAAFKRGLMEHMVGSVTATEVTHGARSGWHLHFHYILLLNLRHIPPEDRENEAHRLGEMAWPAWQSSATNSGLYVDRQAWSVEVGEAVALYPAQMEKTEGGWTLADEATRGAAKRGSGRHPFELLRLSCDEDDEWARELFVEYSAGMKNVRALFWSRGLAELCGVNSDPNDDAGEEQDQEQVDDVTRVLTGELEPREWKGSKARPGVRARRGRMAVAVSRSSVEGFEQERDNGLRDPHAEDQAKALSDLGHPDPDADIDLIDDQDVIIDHSRAPLGDVPRDFDEALDWYARILDPDWVPKPGGLAAAALAVVRPPPPINRERNWHDEQNRAVGGESGG